MPSLIHRLRRFTTSLLVAGGLLCWAAAPWLQAATVTNSVTVITNYYFAYGATAAALNQSLQQARPWKALTDVDAQTVWSVNYHFSYRQAEGRFSPTTFGLKTKVHVTLPFWHMPKDVDPELRQRWLDYLRALYTHEQGHQDLARQATAELGQEFLRIGDYPSLKELRQAINTASTNVIARLREQERQYDVTTKHGATQGAVFRMRPPTQPAGGRPVASSPAK
jgi:predicted secreted Zn-dependent protease